MVAGSFNWQVNWDLKLTSDRDKICVKTTKRNYLKFHNFANNRVFQDNILNSKITKNLILFTLGEFFIIPKFNKGTKSNKKTIKRTAT